jgi:Protein of unknown function (DUF2490)
MACRPPGAFSSIATISRGLAGLVATLMVFTARPAAAQTNGQLWGNITLDWVRSEKLTFELDLEPKVLVVAPSTEPGWWNVDVTPNVEYTVKPWLDLIGELGTGFTRQTDHVNSIEVTPRIGVRFHLLSRDQPRLVHVRELPPRRRIVIRDRVLVESRNTFYTGAGTGHDSTVRFRNRLEFLASLNKEKLTEDGARYFMADWEWFVPLDDPTERFANRQRIRTGFGYRRNVKWRFELLYIWSRSRDTTDEGFKTSDNIINLRLKRVF